MLMIYSSAVLTGRLAAGRNLKPHVRHPCLWNLPLPKPKISNRHLTCFASGYSSPLPFPELRKTESLVWMVKCICWLSATLDMNEDSLGGDRASPQPFPLLLCGGSVVLMGLQMRDSAISWHVPTLHPSALLANWENNHCTFSSLLFHRVRGPPTHPVCLFADLNAWCISFCTQGFFWLSSVLPFSPSDCESTSFIVSLAPSKVHAMVCLSFFLRPPVWLIESFWLPGTMRRTETSLWGSISLDHFSWGCATSWMMRSLQQSSSKTRLIAFPANVISLCWDLDVFSDVGKGICPVHIIVREGLLSWMNELFLPRIFKVSLEQLPWRV